MKLHILIAALFALVPAAAAQTRAQLKAELGKKLEAAATADDKMKVAEWAKENGLVTDHKKILEAIVEAQPDYRPALEALGYEQFDGKWMPAKEAAAKREKALAADFESKGLVEVDGAWVEKDKVADAKKGIFWHDGEPVSKTEKLAFLSGKVRHPRTGELIAAADLEKANQGLFPIEQRWVGLEEANKFHAQLNRPWVLRTKYATLLTTMPLEWFDELKKQVDDSVTKLLPLVGRAPHPAHRPLVGVVANQQEYVAVGTRMGAGDSSYGAFVAEQDLQAFQIGLNGKPAVALWAESWGPYYVRHAAGLAVVHAFAQELGAQVPAWFARAIGGHVDRFWNPQTIGFFGNRFVQGGGLRKLDTWFEKFAITPEMENEEIATNIFQAGLLLDFASRGGDDAVTKAMSKVTEAFASGDGKELGQAIERLQKDLEKAGDKVRDHLKKLVAG
jgi:hypothetical protein